MEYRHTQKGHLDAILTVTAVVLAVGALPLFQIPIAFFTVVGSAAVVFLFALSFGNLTVEDEVDQLLVRFGPLPLFRKRIRYSDITAVRKSTSTWIDGWGIHYVPGRGWTYNLWGFDCVELQLGRRKLRVGTDDPDGLVAFLRKKVSRCD